MPGYRLVTTPTRIPVPGDKLIEEYFGRASTGTDGFSLAHMVAPPGWTEPGQTPEFGELTIMVRGRLAVEVGGERIELAAGQAVWVEPGETVRYANVSGDESEYWAVCIPAFTLDRAHRSDS